MNAQPKSYASLLGYALSVLRVAAVCTAAVVLAALAWFVATESPFTAGDTLGYNLGLVGGSMMLVLLVYSLRKRAGFMRNAGPMRGYFALHMLLGIVGPILVLFHSTFKIGSLNSRVALYSMLLVTASGLVGRFVYRQIHQGLYGREKTLAEAEQELKDNKEGVQSMLIIVPGIEEKLDGFREYSVGELDDFAARTWRFVTMRMRGNRLARSIRNEAWRELEQAARQGCWSQEQLVARKKMASERIYGFVEAVCNVATFTTWVRLFALWHVVHVPFLYLLVITGTVHVIAVNFMY